MNGPEEKLKIMSPQRAVQYVMLIFLALIFLGIVRYWFHLSLAALIVVNIAVVGIILGVFLNAWHKYPEVHIAGSRRIIGGMALILFARLVEVGQHIPSLFGHSLTGYWHIFEFLEHVVGDLGGFALISLGLYQWIPMLVEKMRERRDYQQTLERMITEATAEVNQRNKELFTLCEVTTSVGTSLELEEVLALALQKVLEMLQVEAGVIFILDEPQRELRFRTQQGLPPSLVPKLTSLQLGEGFAGRVVLTGETLVVDDIGQDSRLLFQELREADFHSLVSIPLKSKGKILGVMDLFKKGFRRFSSMEVELLSAVGRQIGVALENALLYEKEQRRTKELASLIQVGQRMTVSLDLDEVLQSIVEAAGTIMGTPYCNLMLLSPDGQYLLWRAHIGIPEEWLRVGRLRIGESLSGWVARHKTPLAVADMAADPRFLFPHWARKYGFISFLGVPMMIKDRLIGVLNIYTPGIHYFQELEINLLSSFAAQAAIAIENAALYREAEELAQQNMRKYQELSLLNEVGNVLRATLSLSRHVYIILTGVTMGKALGFNRAMLFMLDKKEAALVGTMGIGPLSGEEANSIWRDLDRKNHSLLELLENNEAYWTIENSPYNRLCRGMKIPLREDGGILARAALQKSPLLVEEVTKDERINWQYEGRLGVKTLATVPLIAEDEVVAVLMVDNAFNNKSITEDDLRFLSLYCNQAALALSSARLYSQLDEANRELQRTHNQLVQSEKLAALGEMASSVAHEVRNPLAAIGGLARRLAAKAKAGSSEWRYAEIIVKEVERLENLVKETLSVSKDLRIERVPVDLNQLVRDCLAIFQEKLEEQRIQLLLELSPHLPQLWMDASQIKQSILNLLYNAQEAMPHGGYLTLRSYHEEERVFLEVTDTGGGIPTETLENIFNPFFTTKDYGTGLGLTLTRKIIHSHGGAIDVKNRLGEGATFIIILPLKTEGDLSNQPLTTSGPGHQQSAA
jgi:signal transduction histidine kinase/uncharacterized protein YbdZ (MbtH family)